MGKTLVNDRGLQNTSCIRCRSVWSQHLQYVGDLNPLVFIHTQFIHTVHPNSWLTVKSPLLDEAVRDFTLDAYTTVTSITDLTPDLDYSVSINSYYGSEESIPIFGQLTSKYTFYSGFILMVAKNKLQVQVHSLLSAVSELL